jgi:hypothetical protein
LALIPISLPCGECAPKIRHRQSAVKSFRVFGVVRGLKYFVVSLT